MSDRENQEAEPMKTLTAIELLLRIHWSPERIDVSEAPLKWLLHNSLVESDGRDWYVTTERGAVYVEAIRQLPLPEQKWVMP